jgi:hypothetical protein
MTVLPEVRFNARNAVLAMEYGPNPVREKIRDRKIHQAGRSQRVRPDEAYLDFPRRYLAIVVIGTISIKLHFNGKVNNEIEQ